MPSPSRLYRLAGVAALLLASSSRALPATTTADGSTSSIPTPTSSTTTTATTAATASNPLETSPRPAEELELKFNLTSGPFDNYFLRSNLTSAQLLLTNASAASASGEQQQLNRLLVAFPAGNSGAVTYFLPLPAAEEEEGGGGQGGNATGLTMSLVGDSLSTSYGPYDLKGVTGSLELSRNATLGTTLLGSIRTVRDYTEGNGLTNEIFNWTVSQADDQTLWLSRRWLNDTILRDSEGKQTGTARYGLEFLLQANEGTRFNVTPSNNGSYTPPLVEILSPREPRINFTIQTNETTFPGLPVSRLFNPSSSSSSSSSTVDGNTTAAATTTATTEDEDDDDAEAAARRQVSFLTFSSKFTAGGWRFLTYFGRDTLFTTRLLTSHRTFTPVAVESVLSAVLERINSTSGEVCHEETLGDYATLVNINEGNPQRGNEIALDYKMKDTHYLLLPQLADYLLRYNATEDGQKASGGNASATVATNASDAARAFLDRPAVLQNGTSYRTLLEANVAYVMNSTRAFAEDPSNYTGLARIKPGVPVGNWRDSNPGLGWGVYPYDVATALVPAALYAISDLSAAGLLSNATLQDEARRYATVWEERAPEFFKVDIPRSEVQGRLEEYVRLANLSEGLLYGNGSLNATSAAAEEGGNNTLVALPVERDGGLFTRQTAGNDTSSDASPNDTTTDVQTLYALSLLEDGTPVPIQNSDLGFNLVYNRNLSRSTIEAVLDALAPFPRGLLTNIGMLISNPSYDLNRTKAVELDRTAYHGTVSWGWQTAFMAAGLERVLASCGGGGAEGIRTTAVQQSGLLRASWCDDRAFVDRIQSARTDVWHAINGAFEERFAEVWSWDFDPQSQRFRVQDLGSISPEGTESDSIQLWSYGLLGLEDPTRGRGAGGEAGMANESAMA